MDHTITIRADREVCPSVITIATLRENEVESLIFDVSALGIDPSTATVTLHVQPPEGDAYEQLVDNLTVPVTTTLTQAAGVYTCSLKLVAPDRVVASRNLRLAVLARVDADGNTVATAPPDILEQIQQKLADITGSGAGIQGPSGPQGETGPMGPTGPQGDTGPMGPAGPAGAQGPQGNTGDTGPQGPQGDAGINGSDGAQGPQGAQGPIGTPGVSITMHGEVATVSDLPSAAKLNDAYLVQSTGDLYVWNAEGTWTNAGQIVGPQGIQGIQGPKGDTGAVGPQGQEGPIGATGATGAQGPQGDTGPAGPQYNADWNATSGITQILNRPSLAPIATTGSYNDLSDKPTAPGPPVVDGMSVFGDGSAANPMSARVYLMPGTASGSGDTMIFTADPTVPLVDGALYLIVGTNSFFNGATIRAGANGSNYQIRSQTDNYQYPKTISTFTAGLYYPLMFSSKGNNGQGPGFLTIYPDLSQYPVLAGYTPSAGTSTGHATWVGYKLVTTAPTGVTTAWPTTQEMHATITFTAGNYGGTQEPTSPGMAIPSKNTTIPCSIYNSVDGPTGPCIGWIVMDTTGKVTYHAFSVTQMAEVPGILAGTTAVTFRTQ